MLSAETSAMPANLGPDYLAAEQEFRDAETQSEKITALERMWATLPKHKGTEKLQAELKRKLSQARKESQKKGATHSVPFYYIAREGAGQVALAGPPNSGKSRLLAALTHAHPEVAEYPFTTRVPMPGMMAFENVQIQLIDLPPVADEFTEAWLPQVFRNAGQSLMVIDANDPHSLDEIDYIESKLDQWRVARPELMIANKCDLQGEIESIDALRELYGERYRVMAVSAETGEGLGALRRALFDLLALVRVYTKSPGKEPELNAPYVLKRGETVLDAARHVHRDFAEHLKFARRFRKGGRDFMMVDRNHPVQDEDILEFHI
jgi:uncharacterized protein